MSVVKSTSAVVGDLLTVKPAVIKTTCIQRPPLYEDLVGTQSSWQTTLPKKLLCYWFSQLYRDPLDHLGPKSLILTSVQRPPLYCVSSHTCVNIKSASARLLRLVVLVQYRISSTPVLLLAWYQCSYSSLSKQCLDITLLSSVWIFLKQLMTLAPPGLPLSFILPIIQRRERSDRSWLTDVLYIFFLGLRF